MALEIKTTIEIEGSIEQVWTELMDWRAYPNWNPFIRSIQGKALKGEKIHIDLGKMKFNPKIKELDEHKRFAWLGHLLFPGLFDGYHSFSLVQKEPGLVIFIQEEKFKGLLVPFFKKMILVDTKANFDLMNKALKERVEAKKSMKTDHQHQV
jgi:hypothetical protein